MWYQNIGSVYTFRHKERVCRTDGLNCDCIVRASIAASRIVRATNYVFAIRSILDT